MTKYVLGFHEIDKTKLMLAGGKGANLGELARIAAIHVPEGFCVSTQAFQRIMGDAPSIHQSLAQLSQLKLEDHAQIRARSSEIRRIIEESAIPQEIREEIITSLSRLGANAAYAVRSSATAEDLPTASFAGQQDTFLNIIGTEAILQHISKCWASLFSERAVIYRLQNGFDHRTVQLAVVVQKMVFPEVSGILFTADPVTSNRKVLSIDASFGLGEALVAGLVNPDTYKVRSDKIIAKQIAAKKLAIYAVKEGGTHKEVIAPEQQNQQALTDLQILQLAQIGRQIEAHFGAPQDIEWCLLENRFTIVQSRPITTLYPIPEVDDQENHLYISVGHQQMMTDVMKPLGISLRQLTAGRPMFQAGGRMFVDVAQDLASPARRNMLVNVLGDSDPLIKSALVTILERENFIDSAQDESQKQGAAQSHAAPPPPNFAVLEEYDPAIVTELVQRSRSEIEALKAKIQTKSGSELLDFILEDLQQLRKNLSNPQSFGVFMSAMNASTWINQKVQEWLGEKGVADKITQSVPNNVTSEMGLALLDVADKLRPHPEVVAYLQQVKDDDFLDELGKLQGGQEAREAIETYLDQYGMRGVGEIDITRPRWREKPTLLIPLLLGNIKNFAPGESKRRFELGRQQALQKEEELLARLKQLPEGEQKAQQTKRMIDLIRNLIGYREYPKYEIVSRYLIYKQALLKEAEKLVQAGLLQTKEDIYYLTFEELQDLVRTHQLDYQRITRRKDEYKRYEKLTPPRVLTSEGEILTGHYQRDNLPAGALVGLPVSAGVVEGRARIILKLEEADLEEGDILVTPFTDPSWTPLFIAIKALVTEVGGLMTHGAVIAREYGLPAVVGMDNATRRIQDGDRIRVNGTDGYVEILSHASRRNSVGQNVDARPVD